MTKYQLVFEEYLKNYCSTSIGYLQKQKTECLLSDGHRIRPQLVLAWCDYCGGDIKKALPFALAVELIHTMSLIHDDLPCMDNEEIRRGKPTLHKTYGEAIALLTGDRLLAEAFQAVLLSDFEPNLKLKAIELLSTSAQNMADGQSYELAENVVTVDEIENIYFDKTASLLATSCVLGVIAANGTDSQICDAFCFGNNLGMAYQYFDDVKDEDGVLTILTKEIATCRGQEYLNKCSVSSSCAGKYLNGLVRSIG